MRITLNLASRPYVDLAPILKRLRISMIALAVLSVACGSGLYAIHYQAEAARARSHALDSQIATLEQFQQHAQATMRQPDNAKTLAQSEFLNHLIDEKTFSWTLATENLETVLPPGEEVTDIEPNRTKDGAVVLRLRVTGPRDRGIELVRNLEHSRRFLAPRIVGENAENQTGTGPRNLQPAAMPDHVNFDIVATYNTDPDKPVKGQSASSGKTDKPGLPAKADHTSKTSKHQEAKP